MRKYSYSLEFKEDAYALGKTLQDIYEKVKNNLNEAD